jgi:hypothetical protein
LPLLIHDLPPLEEGIDNIIAVLERSDRVRQIDLTRFSRFELARISSSDLEKLSAAMQAPFPELTNLHLRSYGEVVLPDSFLGGSGPRLRELSLDGIPYPGLPKLLLSATHIVDLHLRDIPHSGYFSPEAMGTALSTLTSLGYLSLHFQSPLSRPDWATRPLPPPARSVLSALTHFRYTGDSEYLDDLVAHIDSPRLYNFNITFFNDIVFHMPQLFKFICRTSLNAIEEALIAFGDVTAAFKLKTISYDPDESKGSLLYVDISILCSELDLQVSFLEQLCTSCLPPLSKLEDLYIDRGESWRAHCQDNVENAVWLELLHPFSAVKNLYLSKEFALRIVPALQELIGGRATEVLPTLQNIFLEGLKPSGPIEEGIGKFIATRQTTSHPVVVSRWYKGGMGLSF